MLKWAILLLAGLTISCASHLPASSTGKGALDDSEQGVTDEGGLHLRTKTLHVQEMEQQMRALLGWAMERFEEHQDRLKEELAPLSAPPKIEAVEKELADFYAVQVEEYEAQVLGITERYEQQLEELLTYLRPRVWEIAFAVTDTTDMGYGETPSTGISEVDEIASATLDLIDFRSGADELNDLGQHARFSRLFMDRVHKNEVEGQGRLSLFVSDPMRHYFRKNEDTIGVTVTYQRKGLDPSIPLELRQVVRNRIVRGGTTRFSTEFEPDRTLGNDEGKLRLATGPTDPVMVSKVFFPRVNMDHPFYEMLHDYTAMRDYKTAVVNAATGEVIDCVTWQYLWHISHFGAVAVEKGHTPLPDDDPEEIEALVSGKLR